jgi:hypothetical protein
MGRSDDAAEQVGGWNWGRIAGYALGLALSVFAIWAVYVVFWQGIMEFGGVGL